MFDAVYTETLSDLITDTLLDNDVFTEDELMTKTRKERITAVLPYIFEDFPLFDETYREILESKILNHFYLREIGAETPELFLYYLNRELMDQAPYFNELYNSTLFEFNPLYTVNKTITHRGSGTNNHIRTDNLSESNSNMANSSGNSRTDTQASTSASSQNSSSSEGASQGGFSDTPQGAIAGILDALSPQGSGYLTNASIGKAISNTSASDSSSTSNIGASVNSSSNQSSSSNLKNNTGTQSNSTMDTNEYVDLVAGYDAKPMELIRQFRDNIINVDLKVIKLLNPCFMEIY